MHIKRTALSAAIISVLGAANGIGVVQAAVEPGAYDMVILTTPITSGITESGGTVTGFNFGVDGNWNSSFAFGGSQPGIASTQSMTDTGVPGTSTCSPGTPFGSGIDGDGWAGILGINIAADGALTVSSFNKDKIDGTAGGVFSQYIVPPPGTPIGNAIVGDTSQMTGAVTLATGAMTLDPTGRLGAISGFTLCNKRWNVPDATNGPTPGATAYGVFSTISANTSSSSITGKAFVATVDQNGDGISDYLGVLVSGGAVGDDWGGFSNSPYYEVWRARLLSKGPIVNDDTFTGPPGQTVTHDVLANDLPTGANPGMLITGITYTGSKATVTITPGGKTVTYTGNAGIVGTDSYTYTATGPNSVSRTATVTVINSDPGAAPDSDTTKQGQPVTINLEANDFASIGKNLATYAPVSPSAKGGTVTDNPIGTATYAPPLDLVGTDTFTYTFQDNNGMTSNIATVTVSVAGGPLVSQGTYGNGTIADSVGATDGVIAATDVPVPDDGVTTPCLGGCFDFVVTGAAASTQIVLPRLTTPLDTSVSIRYRKFAGGAWKDFDTTGGDSIASTTITVNGGCPAPDAGSWKPWTDATGTTSATAGAANNGDDCVRLTIADNGNNDSDVTAGTIADPGGPGQFVAAQQPSGAIDEFRKSTSGGCSISGENVSFASRADWAVLGLIGLWFGAFRLRRKT